MQLTPINYTQFTLFSISNETRIEQPLAKALSYPLRVVYISFTSGYIFDMVLTRQ